MQTTIQVAATKPITAFTFKEEALAGNVLFHSVRSDGTVRRIRLLVPDTEEFETAEWVMEQREAKVPMRNIARQMHLAVPTVRRLINRYLLTEDVLDADAEELAELSSAANAGLDPEHVPDHVQPIADRPSIADAVLAQAAQEAVQAAA